jgi:hypothetical protein
MGKQNETRPGRNEGQTGAQDFEAHGQARGEHSKMRPDAERLEHILCSSFDPNEPTPDDIAPPKPWHVTPGATDETGEMTDDALETFCAATDALMDALCEGGGDPLMNRCLTEAERADLAAMRDGRAILLRRPYPIEAIMAQSSRDKIGDLAVLVTHLRHVGVRAKAIAIVDRGPLPRTPDEIIERWPALSYFRTGEAPHA